MSKVAISQSNYIPWKGYFDLINSVDHFVFYDTAQYTKNDWRNRNKIQTFNSLAWITIPVYQHSLEQTILDTKVANIKWGKKHWQTIRQAYSKAPYFKDYKEIFEDAYLQQEFTFLSEINFHFIKVINALLGITTKLHWSSDFQLNEERSERLLGICQQLKSDVYVSGPAAKEYLNEELFLNNNVKVEWMDYSGYPEYEQMHDPFEHGVTILDLIFNEGPNAKNFMKSFT